MSTDQRIFMTGHHVALRPLEPSDADALSRAFNDPELQALAFQSPLAPVGSTVFERRLREAHPAPFTGAPSSHEVAVTLLARPGELIGVGGLYKLDRHNGNAELGVSITDPASRGQGLGTEAHRLMIELAFDRLGLTRLYGHVKVGNEPALRLVTSLGFVREGTLRAHRVVGGRPLDLLVFGLLRDELVTPAPHCSG